MAGAQGHRTIPLVKLGGLPEGHPDRSREVLFRGAGPQRQHIDSAILSMISGVASPALAVPGLGEIARIAELAPEGLGVQVSPFRTNNKIKSN
jgi:hypothetical protein